MCNPTSPRNPESIPARIQVGPGPYLVGYIKDGLFYVGDDISNGVSYRAPHPPKPRL